jgi:MoxR-like ATPase
VILTSNDEREFPAPFLRRCLQLTMPDPNETRLKEIVTEHLGAQLAGEAEDLLRKFVTGRKEGALTATDQLLNAIHLLKGGHGKMTDEERKNLEEALLKALQAR